MDWQEKETVKKGNIGESIVTKYLEKLGYIVYEPVTDGAHAFDKFISLNKKSLAIAEVKTKAKRNFMPDTGIDFRHYNEYKLVSEKYNLDFFIFFIDEMLGCIYGGKLSELEKPNCYEYNDNFISYPKVEQNKNGSKIIYFYQPNMKIIHELSIEEIELIKSFNTRNYNYL